MWQQENDTSSKLWDPIRKALIEHRALKAARLLVLGAVLAVAVSYFFVPAYAAPAGCHGWRTHLLLQFAGADHAKQAFDCWANHRSLLASALGADTSLAIIYAVVLTWWVAEARLTAVTRLAQSWADIALYTPALAAAFDLLENAFLRKAFLSPLVDPGDASAAVAFAIPKWILLTLAVSAATQGVYRALRSLTYRKRDEFEVFFGTGRTAWERNTRVPADPKTGGLANDCQADRIGIAFSGGGIRSAVFSMGALQSFQSAKFTGPPGKLDDVSYISAVSGGGFLAGARELLLASDKNTEPFAPGSNEEDYVRRHGDYIAETIVEWISALARVLAGIFLNVSILLGGMFLVALPVGWIQRALLFHSRGTLLDKVPPPLWWAVGLTVLLALAAYIASVLLRSPASRKRIRRIDRSFTELAAVAGIVGAACFAMVALLPWFAHVTQHLDIFGVKDQRGIAGLGAIATTVATWLGLKPPTRWGLNRILKKQAKASEEEESTAATDDGKKREEEHRAGWISRLRVTVWAPGVLLGLTALYVFARLSEKARIWGVHGSWKLPGHTFEAFMLWRFAAISLLVWYVFADQTAWSLHPFYKRRVANAFSLRRDPKKVDETQVDETPYDVPIYPNDERFEEVEGPKLILGAAAHFSGKRAPPGRRALSFVFTRDWVGGPETGYVNTDSLREALGKGNEGNATIIAAMAISSAAFASAMGRHSMGSLNSVLAVLNLRLGVWLPSASQLDRMKKGQASPVHVRRIGYLLKEIFRIFDKDDRFLYVTDGGHLENLGLVELLRRRCSLIVCLDGSGGPLTLFEGVRLAEEELGVKVCFPDGSYDAVRPGSMTDKVNQPEAVRARMAAKRVLVGSIEYPDLGPDFPKCSGTLVYARCALTKETDDVCLEYASRHLRFPNDPTGDQWFDVDQFNSYLALGRQVGAEAVKAAEKKRAAEESPPLEVLPDLPSAEPPEAAAGS